MNNPAFHQILQIRFNQKSSSNPFYSGQHLQESIVKLRKSFFIFLLNTRISPYLLYLLINASIPNMSELNQEKQSPKIVQSRYYFKTKMFLFFLLKSMAYVSFWRGKHNLYLEINQQAFKYIPVTSASSFEEAIQE